MLRCIAVDDEPLALELLEDNISKVPFLQLVATCSNPIEAMKVMEAQPIDLVFADIQMPGMTGIQFIKSLSQKPLFILITAYEKYALEGYELDVVDYLVKPVSLDRFIKACNKARELFDLRHRPAESQAPAPDYFFVNADYSMIKLNFPDIQWVEGLKDYVKIFLQSAPNKPIITRMSLKSLEEELPSKRFLRVHKSYIINKDQVTAVKKNGVMIGPHEIPVSETNKDVLALLTGKA